MAHHNSTQEHRLWAGSRCDIGFPIYEEKLDVFHCNLKNYALSTISHLRLGDWKVKLQIKVNDRSPGVDRQIISWCQWICELQSQFKLPCWPLRYHELEYYIQRSQNSQTFTEESQWMLHNRQKECHMGVRCTFKVAMLVVWALKQIQSLRFWWKRKWTHQQKLLWFLQKRSNEICKTEGVM